MDSLLLVCFVTLHAASFAASQNCSCNWTRASGPLQYYQVSENDRRLAFEAVVNSARQFAGKFIWAVGQTSPNTLVCSPFSVSMALSLLTYGTESYVFNEMCYVLGLPPNYWRDIKPGFQDSIDGLNLYQGFTIRLASKIYIPCSAGLQSHYADTAMYTFRSEVEAVNFTNPDCASERINAWCSYQTNGLINDIVSPDDLSDPESIVLVNALYFSGSWKIPFETARTQLGQFYFRTPDQGIVSTQSFVPLPFMNANDVYNYGILPARFDARFIELRYTGEGIRMLIILPNSLNGVGLVESNLNTITLREIIGLGRPTQVELSLPKITIESTLDLKDVLHTMNVNGIFNPSSITGISDRPRSVSKITHKAVLKIDEYGTEGAAATSIAVDSRFGPIELEERATFIVDHPFVLLLIMENNVDFYTLFAARYTGFY